MNRGHIPGFYYDEEKKKYFQITATHVAPAGAKYAKTNVQREERSKQRLKKRKRAERLVRKQTVNMAASLRSSHLSTMWKREIGYSTLGRLRALRDETIIDSLEYRRILPRIHSFATWPKVRDAHYAVDQSRMFLATSHNNGQTSCVYSYEWEDEIEGLQFLGDYQQRPLVNLSGGFVSMQHFDSTLLLVSDTGDDIRYYLGPSDPPDHQSTSWQTVRLTNTVGTIHACAYDPVTQNLAFAGTGLLVVNCANMAFIGGKDFNQQTESFAATWLQPSVLAYGQHTEKYLQSNVTEVSHTVRLWDLRIGDRSNDSSIRLNRQKRVTGLERPELSAHYLLVADPEDLSLYDLRMHSIDSAPLLSIPHTSNGTLDFAVQSDLIAAIDDEYGVQVYSMRTSQRLRTLTTRGTAWPIKRLRWQENRRGSPYLQACGESGTSTVIHQWRW